MKISQCAVLLKELEVVSTTLWPIIVVVVSCYIRRLFIFLASRVSGRPTFGHPNSEKSPLRSNFLKYQSQAYN